MRALHIHHDANSLPGLIGEVLADRGIAAVPHQVCCTPGSPVGRPDFPDPTEFDLVVVYGSRWSVYDPAVAHWVDPELELLRAADAAGVPVLGMCFGAQMLSAAHGGAVRPGVGPEVGWLRIEPIGSPESGGLPAIESGPWFQWHFDVFDVPPGAELLATSRIGPQTFRLRANLATQFHPEVDRDVVAGWFVDDMDQIVDLGIDPDDLLAECDRHRVAALLRADRLVEQVLGWRSGAR
ncbi:MAG: type 1 glutamine amidotransferase [Microthrixaceae bacterium]